MSAIKAMIQGRWAIVILLIVGVCCSQTAVALQDFGIQTEVEGTTRISLDLLSQPDTFEKELWLNWTLRLTVLEWNPVWNTTSSLDHPDLIVAVRADGVDFTEHHNVSFGLNRTMGGFGMSIVLIGYQYVGTWFDLGNLSGVATQALIVGVKFADDMPSTSYTLDIHIYDPAATTTTETSTTTETTTTTDQTTEDTTDTDSQVMGLPEYIVFLSVCAVVIVAVMLFKRKSS